MIKKKSVVALVLFLLIPLVWTLGGMLFGLINPESAAGHPNYVQSYHRLSLLKHTALWGSEAVYGIESLSLLSLFDLRPQDAV